MTEYKVIGKSVPRIDALEKVTGRAKYTSDIKVPGMLYAKIKGSPYPHARIINIDTSKAEKLRGVKGVVTGKDAPRKLIGAPLVDMPLLANYGIVRYVGEPVSAVAADTIEIAEEALDLIEVDYEELPAVFEVEEAFEENPQVIVHPKLSDYERLDKDFPEMACPIQFEPNRPNVFTHYKVRQGEDVEVGFREADLVVENRFVTARVQHVPLETLQCIAQYDLNGSITIMSTLQGIYLGKAVFTNYFDISPSKVRVISPYVGGAFGCRTGTSMQCIAILLARKSLRPVKLAFTRDDDMTLSFHNPNFVIYIKDGVSKDGCLTARHIKILYDGGAYVAEHSLSFVGQCSEKALATYRIPAFKLDSYGVYTNKIPTIAMRSVGGVQVAWALERQMDIIAERLNIDPIKLRRKNLLKEGAINLIGEPVSSFGAKKCLDQVAKWMEKAEKPEPEANNVWKIGNGISVGSHFSICAPVSTATVKLYSDGVIEVAYAEDELGQGSMTVLAQIAAEEFGVSLDKVRVVRGDTASAPIGLASVASRTTYFAGNALVRACQEAKRKIFALAAPMLEMTAEELEMSEGKIYVKGMPDKAILISDLFGPTGVAHGLETMAGRGEHRDPFIEADPETGQSKKLYTWHIYGAYGAQVAVNVQTGKVKVLKAVGAYDMGRAINPKLCEGQIEGGLGIGLGIALNEELEFDKGALLNPNLIDYKMATAMELPSVKNTKSIIAAVPCDSGPYGAKGLGEMTSVTPVAAITNAVCNALGIAINEIPITREKVIRALKETRK